MHIVGSTENPFISQKRNEEPNVPMDETFHTFYEVKLNNDG